MTSAKGASPSEPMAMPDQPGAQQDTQLRPAEAELAGDAVGRESHGQNVEAIEGVEDDAQSDDQPLIQGHAGRVDAFLELHETTFWRPRTVRAGTKLGAEQRVCAILGQKPAAGPRR